MHGKPSKNSKCPCGSGKKYRKCHGKQDRLVAEVKRMFVEKEQKRKTYQKKYGYARPPMSVMMGDKRMVVIGGSIYQQTREGPYGFMNLIHDCALEIFGTAYLEHQEQLPMENRHPALQWMSTYIENEEYLRRNGIDDPKASRIGSGGAWFRFGYDLFTIRDNAKLHARMTERLLNSENFQGARYELAVAAICIAAGFELEFEDESDNSSKHAEFVGTDRLTGHNISVEAKSRHRHGVKGFLGGRNIPPGQKVDIRGLVLDAFENIKDSSHASYIFVDVNLPPAPDEENYRRWQDEIEQTMQDLAAEGYATPSPVNAIFFTNDPSHYLLKEQIGKPSDNLWFKHFLADTPRKTHPSTDMVKRVLDAFTARIAPPADFPDFQ